MVRSPATTGEAITSASVRGLRNCANGFFEAFAWFFTATAAMLSTPYVLDYDLVVLGLGAAFLVADGLERGFLPWEKSLLALVWISPLVARTLAEAASLPLGQLGIVVLLALAVRRTLARAEFALPAGAAPSPS